MSGGKTPKKHDRSSPEEETECTISDVMAVLKRLEGKVGTLTEQQAAANAETRRLAQELADTRQKVVGLTAENVKLQEELNTTRAMLNSHIDSSQQQLQQLQVHISKAQAVERADNVMIFGLPEKEGSRADLKQRVAAELRAAGGLEADADVVEVNRVGDGTVQRPHPRPVRVHLASQAAKHKVFAAKRQLRTKKIFADADLTPFQLQLRKAQMAARAELAAAGKRPHWRGTELWYWDNGRKLKHGGGSGAASASHMAVG